MTGDKFRAQADECLKAARSMADPERKLVQLDLAHRWLRLAAEVDSASRGIRHLSPNDPLSKREFGVGHFLPLDEPLAD